MLEKSQGIEHYVRLISLRHVDARIVIDPFLVGQVIQN